MHHSAIHVAQQQFMCFSTIHKSAGFNSLQNYATAKFCTAFHRNTRGTVLLSPFIFRAEGTPKLFTIHFSLFTKKDGDYSPSFLMNCLGRELALP